MIEADDVFNPKDFESIRLVIRFKNFTTTTEVDSSKEIELVEVGDRSVILQLPAKSCSIGHNVEIDISKKIPKSAKTTQIVSVTGKVVRIEDCEDDDDCSLVEITCVQFDEAGWKQFLNLYSARQAEIIAFLNSVRG